MDRTLRRLTPFVLLALAVIVWFEPFLLGGVEHSKRRILRSIGSA